MAQRMVRMEMFTIIGNDTGGFLAAMLQGMQAKGGEGGGILCANNTKNPAFLTQMVIVVRGGRQHLGVVVVGHKQVIRVPSSHLQ